MPFHMHGLLVSAALNNIPIIDYFQVETLCVSNHTVCRFAEQRGFSPILGRAALCATASRFAFFNGKTP